MVIGIGKKVLQYKIDFMENMSKEFWEQMDREHPKAMVVFREWIDGYKVRVGWDKLLGKKVKFHDLPFEMQNGVIAKFDLELVYLTNGKTMEDVAATMLAHREELKNIFKELQRGIDLRMGIAALSAKKESGEREVTIPAVAAPEYIEGHDIPQEVMLSVGVA
jgi:hypothetical protein